MHNLVLSHCYKFHFKYGGLNFWVSQYTDKKDDYDLIHFAAMLGRWNDTHTSLVYNVRTGKISVSNTSIGPKMLLFLDFCLFDVVGTGLPGLNQY